MPGSVDFNLGAFSPKAAGSLEIGADTYVIYESLTDYLTIKKGDATGLATTVVVDLTSYPPYAPYMGGFVRSIVPLPTPGNERFIVAINKIVLVVDAATGG